MGMTVRTCTCMFEPYYCILRNIIILLIILCTLETMGYIYIIDIILIPLCLLLRYNASVYRGNKSFYGFLVFIIYIIDLPHFSLSLSLSPPSLSLPLVHRGNKVSTALYVFIVVPTHT